MADETIKGTVARVVKGKYGPGIQLEGRDGWLNATSKLAAAWPNVQQGDSVACKLWTSDAGKLYLSAITVTGAANGAKPQEGPGSYAFRDISISRQSSVKSALEYMRLLHEAGTDQEYSINALLFNAERIEAWILAQPPEAPESEPEPEFTE